MTLAGQVCLVLLFMGAAEAKPAHARGHGHGGSGGGVVYGPNGAGNHTLDIVLLGDKYLSEPSFQADAQRVVSAISTFDPFPTYGGAIRFTIGTGLRNLYCTYDAPTGRLLTCDPSQVATVLHDLGLVYDKVIVLVNNGQYGGSGGDVAVAYNGGLMSLVAQHEFTHSLTRNLPQYVLDEYVLYLGGTTDNQLHANCFGGPGNPTFPFVGCNYGAWYRSTDCSIMRSPSCPSYNAVTNTLVRQAIGQYLQ